MAKELYKYQGHMIGHHYGVSLDPHDKMLAGPKGWICTYGSDRMVAYTIRSDGSEKINVFENKDLYKWILRIGGLGTPESQCYWANNPAERHK